MIRDDMVKRSIAQIGVKPQVPGFVSLAGSRGHAGPSLIVDCKNGAWLGDR
jgi:hypothetical protein